MSSQDLINTPTLGTLVQETGSGLKDKITTSMLYTYN